MPKELLPEKSVRDMLDCMGSRHVADQLLNELATYGLMLLHSAGSERRA